MTKERLIKGKNFEFFHKRVKTMASLMDEKG